MEGISSVLNTIYLIKYKGEGMEEHLKKKLFGIIQKDISIDPASLDPKKPIRDQISLDSMRFVSIIARIELELDIELPMSVMEARTLNEFLIIIDDVVKK
jgi:acyl carrier protein